MTDIEREGFEREIKKLKAEKRKLEKQRDRDLIRITALQNRIALYGAAQRMF